VRYLKSAIVALSVLCALPACAGPPFLTDDPEPVPYQHWEFYAFGARDAARDSTNVTGPAIEVNNGIARDTQLHVVVPETTVSGGGLPSQRGLGDAELGVKYRFIHQTKSTPELGTFPLLELPTGDTSKGLGNGRTWYKIPIWLQKDHGAWTTYGGGGYAINTAAGQRDYWFGGWLLQRTLSPKLTLGSEIFAQGATADTGRSTVLWNAGGYYNFNPDFSLLFSGGHSFSGEGHTVGYLGLYWTWGPKGTDKDQGG
jgi:hypothetical protein